MDLPDRAEQAALRVSEGRLAADLAGMRRLYEVHATLAGSPDFGAALDEILDAAVTFTNTDRGTVQLVSADGERMEIVRERGYPPGSAFVEHFRSEGFAQGCGAARTERQRLIIEDAATFPGLVGTADGAATAASGVAAAQSTPMVSRNGEMIGMLSTQFREPHRPTDDELRLIDLLAWTAAEYISRHRADQALRESQERQAFLLRLSDTLRPLGDPAEIVAAAAGALGRHLGAGQVVYAESDASGEYVTIQRAWNDGGMPSNAGRHRLDAFGPAFIADLRQGRSLSIDDVARDPRTASSEALATFAGASIKALLTIPRIKGGRLVAVLGVHSSTPHAWRPEDVAVAEEVAERLWAAVEHARAQAALRASEARYRAIVEEAADYAIFTTDAQRRIDSWPPGAEAVFGWTPEEAIGQPLDITFTPEDRAKGEVEKVFGAARETGFSPNIRWHLRKDGRRVFIEGSARALHGVDGAFRGVLKIGQDVTERRATEAALGESEERFRQFAENSADALWIADATTGRLEYLSPAFERLWGEPRQSMMADLARWAELVHPEDREEAVRCMPRVLVGEVAIAEYRIVRPDDGRICWIRDTGFPIRDAQGRVERVAGIAQDVTESRRRLEHQKLLLAELQHRVRNVLAVVRSLARRTAVNSDSVEDLSAHLDGRLNALARTQAAVTRDPAAGVELEQIVAEELLAYAAHEGGPVRIGGPKVRLKPKSAETLGLAVHELATNSIKYGALSDDDGKLTVAWTVDDRDGAAWLRLEWAEAAGVIKGDRPQRRGFGTELLERTLAYDLKAATTLDFKPGLFRCTVDFSLQGRVVD